jgi:hypothetical protein
MSLYVQYGCGFDAHPDWLNFDASPRLRLERTPLIGQLIKLTDRAKYTDHIRYGNIVAGLPVASGSVDGLYSSHVLEHIDRSSVITALRNSLTMLRPGGVFRVVVPDLVPIARLFLTEVEAGNPAAADRFMRHCYLGEEQPVRGFLQTTKSIWSHASHKWMYDARLLESLLLEVGFRDIRPCSFNDSADPRFKEVEHEDRFSFEGLPGVAFEAFRPLSPQG